MCIKKTPKVSVITVVYNRAESIGRTIEDTLSQTYTNLEYIVVDGGSTDGTTDSTNLPVGIMAIAKRSGTDILISQNYLANNT